MKSRLFGILLMMLISVAVTISQTKSVVINNKAYSKTTLDTTAWVQIGAYARVGLVLDTNDSTAVEIAVDTRKLGLTTYSSIDSTTVISASNTGTHAEYILRDRAAEKCLGLNNSVRFRFKWRDSSGSTAPKYTATLYQSWQSGITAKKIFDAKTYADAQLDTSLALFTGPYGRVSVYSNSSGTVNVKIYVDTRTIGASSWTLKDSSTVTAKQNEWVLRDNTTDRIPGAGTQIRLRPKFLTSNAGSSPTYQLLLNLSK